MSRQALVKELQGWLAFHNDNSLQEYCKNVMWFDFRFNMLGPYKIASKNNDGLTSLSGYLPCAKPEGYFRYIPWNSKVWIQRQKNTKIACRGDDYFHRSLVLFLCSDLNLSSNLLEISVQIWEKMVRLSARLLAKDKDGFSSLSWHSSCAKT